MATTITSQDANGATETIRFDAVESERHEFGTDITEHPVETGEDVADHALPQLDRIGLEVFVSNQPTFSAADPSGKRETIEITFPRYEPPLAPTPGALFGAIGDGIRDLLSGGREVNVTLLTFDPKLNRPREFYETLKEWRDETRLVRVLTSVREYENMLIESVTPIKDRSTGAGMRFSIELKQIRIVQTAAVSATSPADTRGSNIVDLGSKATSAVVPGSSTEGGLKSLAASALDDIQGGG